MLESTRNEQKKVQMGLRVTLRKEQDEGCNEWMTSERTQAIERALEAASEMRKNGDIEQARKPDYLRIKTTIKTRNTGKLSHGPNGKTIGPVSRTHTIRVKQKII